MRTFFLTLLSLILMTACEQQKTSDDTTPKTVGVDVTTASKEEIDGLSIYQLTSSWKTQEGEEITFRDLNGEVLVVAMIYTSCQSACPRLIADMRTIESKISPSIPEGVRYVLISIDPTHDTPERLKAFSIDNDMRDARWLFLQGNEASVREFANVVAVRYDRISPMDFSHSNIISVFDQRGVMLHQQEGLATDYQETVETVVNAFASNQTSAK